MSSGRSALLPWMLPTSLLKTSASAPASSVSAVIACSGCVAAWLANSAIFAPAAAVALTSRDSTLSRLNRKGCRPCVSAWERMLADTCWGLAKRAFKFSGGTSPRTSPRGTSSEQVESLQEWPGVHRVEALTTGKTLEGWWFDRTQEYLARRAGRIFGSYQYATRESLELAPLPCWKHLTPEKRQRLAAAMVAEIEAEAADRRERSGAQALGPAAILAQNPESRPLKTKRSPAPAVHAASRAVRRELRNAYFLFVAAYRGAAEKLRAGNRNVPFPMGCFPPPLPFVGG